ncbi:MAG: sugar transferase [Oscillatoriales cyanobacterium SM2_2_1]|nr:sugar transferase [Oscillatoriales cyanobacterium SM2_2_1]
MVSVTFPDGSLFSVRESLRTRFSLSKRFRQLRIDLPSGDRAEHNIYSFDGSANWLSDYLEGRSVDQVLVSPEVGEEHLKRFADICQRAGVELRLQLPIAREFPQQRLPIQWLGKRVFDWCAALVILLVLSPVLITTAALIMTTMPGSIFFYQWRVGVNGKLFRIIKFRSMIEGAEKLHHRVMTGKNGLHKCADDPRITPLGKFLRKYSIDELPQLFNVLRGEMSLVGPRPWAIYDALRIPPHGMKRLNALPGITGAWQVKARSKLLDLDAVTEFDLSYLRQWSIWEDFKILLMTVPKVLSGFGAC